MLLFQAFQNEPRDHSPGCDVVRPVSTITSQCREFVHERGIEVSYDAVRYWRHRFSQMFASGSRKYRVAGMKSIRWRWHLDEMFVKINGEMHFLWRAVDRDGDILQSDVTKRRDKKAALKFLKKSMNRHGRPHILVADKL